MRTRRRPWTIACGSKRLGDPYPPLREKINAARDKFKGLMDYCCCLLLYNRDKPLVLLDWRHVYGAMPGNLGFSVPIHVPGRPAPENVEISSIFMSGGKMHKQHKGVLSLHRTRRSVRSSCSAACPRGNGCSTPIFESVRLGRDGSSNLRSCFGNWTLHDPQNAGEAADWEWVAVESRLR